MLFFHLYNVMLILEHYSLGEITWRHSMLVIHSVVSSTTKCQSSNHFLFLQCIPSGRPKRGTEMNAIQQELRCQVGGVVLQNYHKSPLFLSTRSLPFVFIRSHLSKTFRANKIVTVQKIIERLAYYLGNV